MKKLYIILLAALLLTLAACLTACSAKPVSLRGTEAPNLPGPTNDALKVTDEGQDWNITLEQVDKENFAEDDRLLAKGSYQVFQLNQEGSGDTLTATAEYIAPLAGAEWTKHRDDVLWNPDEAKKKAKEEDEKRNKEALAAKFAHIKDDPGKETVEL